MSTHEREISTPVDLATGDGRRLNAEAVGWSRRPLHRANLSGRWGRNKRWDYWAVLAGDLVVSAVYADVDYLGLANVWWARLDSGTSGGAGVTVPLAGPMELPEVHGARPLHIERRGFGLDISTRPDGSTSIVADWLERDGTPGRLDAVVDLPEGHESLNVVIPWSETRFQYTSKHQARPVSGSFTVGDTAVEFQEVGRGAWGTLDVGRGRWPYRTRWNWGGGAGTTTGGAHVIGLQIGGRWTRGTGHTENGFIVDGRLTKIGREVSWYYDWRRPLEPWTVVDPGGRLELTLRPRFDRHDKTDLLVLRTEVHQVFGDWTGYVIDDDGERFDFDGLQGFAEESRSRW